MGPEERIKEIEEFLRFALETWPKRRESALHEIAKRCSNCALSERHSPLTDGICSACREHTPNDALSGDTAAMSRELDELLESHQGKAAGRHDALVMFSGGKDSALLLHLLRQKFPGLRLLALMVDNGFTSSIAFANAKRVATILSDVEYVTIRPKETLFRNTFRYALTHLNAGGCYSSVDRLGGDLVFDIGRNTAAAFGIPLLIHGGTRAQAQLILKLFSYETPRSWEREKRESTGGFSLRDIYAPEELKYWWDGSSWPADRVPRVIFPFYAWPYDEHAVRREVQALGLFEKGKENPIASNSDLIPVNLAVDNSFLGYSGYEPEFAQLIRGKKADKNIWLSLFESVEYLGARGLLLPGCIAETLTRLGLTHADVGLPKPAA